jgi:hypothetical protein
VVAIAQDRFGQSKGISPKSETSKESTTLIPLKEIWAYRMPGTKDATKLGNVRTPKGAWSNPTINELSRLFGARLSKREKAGPAFVVEGVGEAALKNMGAGLKSEPEKYVPSGKEISLVFYTHLSSYYVRIDAVERTAKKFVVPCQLVTHSTYNMTFHFALIPLGKLQPGEYTIEIEHLPTIDKLGGRVEIERDLSWIVCGSSTFHVGERK